MGQGHPTPDLGRKEQVICCVSWNRNDTNQRKPREELSIHLAQNSCFRRKQGTSARVSKRGY